MKRRGFILAALFVLGSIGVGVARSQQPLSLEEGLIKARVSGKYGMLLKQIKVAKDRDNYSDFSDYGIWNGTEWAGNTNLPPGYWVYVYPYWYIWRDLNTTPKPNRAWGPEQAIGPPDTMEAGDIATAWASQTPDGQEEWVLLEYAEPVVPSRVHIYETYNPGSVQRVSVFTLDGEEVEIWRGADPTAVGSGKGVSDITFKVKFKTNRVKVYLDSPAVDGWNEIDAVGLEDTSGKTQWATAVDASSTYAQQANSESELTDTTEQTLLRLEEQVRQLQATIEELKRQIKQDRLRLGDARLLYGLR